MVENSWSARAATVAAGKGSPASFEVKPQQQLNIRPESEVRGLLVSCQYQFEEKSREKVMGV